MIYKRSKGWKCLKYQCVFTFYNYWCFKVNALIILKFYQNNKHCIYSTESSREVFLSKQQPVLSTNSADRQTELQPVSLRQILTTRSAVEDKARQTDRPTDTLSDNQADRKTETDRPTARRTEIQSAPAIHHVPQTEGFQETFQCTKH